MPFTFDPAGAAELDTALAIARAAAKAPFSHWDAEYPNREILADDIARRALYFFREAGTPIAIIAILDGAEAETEFPWPETQARFCLLSRLGILPEAQGRGLAAEIVRCAEAVARARGFTLSRLLALSDDPPANHIYRKLGYQALGCQPLWGAMEFLGYERAL